MNNISLWRAILNTSQFPSYPSLQKDIDVDVVIIGGGITGLTAATELTQAGKTVALLESHRVGLGTTGYSTGNLYIPVQPYYQTIAKKFNLEMASIIANSRRQAIDYIEYHVKEKKIDCKFHRRPWYIYTQDENQVAGLEYEVETLKHMKMNVHYCDTLPYSIPFKKAATMPDQARFNPLNYVLGLAMNLNKENGHIFEDTKVIDIQENHDGCIVSTATNKITAKKVIIATHTPIGINSVQMFTGPYRSYVVAVRLKRDHYPEGHLWDLNQPHHSISTHPISSEHPELLMVAGSHHKTGQGEAMELHYKELQQFLKQHFSAYDIEYRWSAQHYQPADDVPYIGLADRFAKHRYIATGYSADGLVYGTLAGKIISDIICKRANSLKEVYESNRFTPFASGGKLIKENMNVFLQYLKDLPMLPTHSFDDVKKGCGKIIEIHGEKCGVCRDDKNNLHVVSAVCTHMKCIVNWNNAEQTWDCPCHGSRFTAEGKVIEGPAVIDLAKKDYKR